MRREPTSATRTCDASNLYPVPGYRFIVESVIERLETGMSVDDGPAWVAPDACTLPTAEQPLRVAEFDELFRTAVTWVDRRDATTLRLGLAPGAEVAARAADLAVRESDCCAFFTFTLAVSGARVHLEVTVPEMYTEVLDGLAARVAAGARS